MPTAGELARALVRDAHSRKLLAVYLAVGAVAGFVLGLLELPSWVGIVAVIAAVGAAAYSLVRRAFHLTQDG